VHVRNLQLAEYGPLPDNQAMTTKKPHDISVSVATQFIDEQSKPQDNRYVFAYTITIQNRGSLSARLLSRHWIITDGNGDVREVCGEGVVGEQPLMQPGEGYQYTSGAVLETAVGTMQGSYQMLAEDGTRFDADIPSFVLSIPRTLH
jgi:ApaG protein